MIFIPILQPPELDGFLCYAHFRGINFFSFLYF